MVIFHGGRRVCHQRNQAKALQKDSTHLFVFGCIDTYSSAH